MINNNYWLTWSPRQNAFHIENELVGLRINREAFLQERKVDYVPIGLFTSEEAANAEAEKLTEILRKRDQNRCLH